MNVHRSSLLRPLGFHPYVSEHHPHQQGFRVRWWLADALLPLLAVVLNKFVRVYNNAVLIFFLNCTLYIPKLLSHFNFFCLSFSTLTINIFVCVIQYLMKIILIKIHLKLNPFIYFISGIM